MSTPKNTRPNAGGKINYSRTTRPDFNKSATTAPDPAKQARRESVMVKRDKPKPVLRPAPHIAAGPDRTAFNQTWNNERQSARTNAAPVKQAAPDREARKAAFKAKRRAQAQTRTKQKTQSRNH